MSVGKEVILQRNFLELCIGILMIVITGGGRAEEKYANEGASEGAIREYYERLQERKRTDQKLVDDVKKGLEQVAKWQAEEEAREAQDLEKENLGLREQLKKLQQKGEATGRLQRLREENRRLKQQMKRFR